MDRPVDASSMAAAEKHPYDLLARHHKLGITISPCKAVLSAGVVHKAPIGYPNNTL